MYGSFNPFPQQYGAEKSSQLEIILDSFLESQGTALTKERGTYNWVVGHAISRFFNEMYRANNILSHVTDPYKMPAELIPRWEKIYGLSSEPEESEKIRRTRIAMHIFFFRRTPNFTTINDFLTLALGEIYVGIVNTKVTDAVLYVPGGGVVPGGPTFLDGNLNEFSPWTGTTCHMAIQLTQPVGMSDAEFYKLAGEIQLLDILMPIWMTFDWFKDGPNGAGFYLDQENNLDNQRFD